MGESIKSRLSGIKGEDNQTENLADDLVADATTDMLKSEDEKGEKVVKEGAVKEEKKSGNTSENKTSSASNTANASTRTTQEGTTQERTGIIGFIYDHKWAFLVGVMFLIFLFIQLRFIYEVWFDPDELDIYTVAFEMFKGKVLYRDIPSQHMPWTYIISWIFYVFGARTATLQRLYFYIMFAGFWASFIYIYRKYVNKWVLIIQPFLFFAIIANLDFATQILSEHIGVIGGQIFLLEFIMFLKKKDLSIGSCIRMSLAVLFTFGGAFINIFPLFFLGLGVLCLEIKWGFENHEKMADWWKKMLKRYGRLVGIVAVPWLIMFIYMLATHSFHDFGFDAYTINTLYYPQYMAGLGGSTLTTLLAPLLELNYFFSGLGITDIGIKTLTEILMLCSGIYLAYKKGRSAGVIAGVTVFFYVFSFGNRGFFNYHATAFIGVLAMATAYVMVTYMVHSKEDFDKRPVLTKFTFGLMCVLFIILFSGNIQLSFNFLYGNEFNHYQEDTDIVDALTDEDERIWQANVCDTVPWAAKQVTTGPSVSTPWMWDAVGKNKMQDFEQNPTRVVLFYIGYESWGNKMADYAPEAYYYIVNNYKFIPGSTMVWVRNDYYEEACVKLGIDPNTPNDNGVSVSPYNTDPSEMPGMTAEDRARYLESLSNGAPQSAEPADDKVEEPTTEEMTTEQPTTEASTEDINVNDDEEDAGAVIMTPDENDTNNVTDTTTGPGSTSGGNGPGDVTVSPADERGGSDVNSDTPGAVQAPDGSWVIPDDSDGPGM